eukprot:TRINITY_DN214_c0_g1_i1.p1 TRINITY_DN214_c0_g1~~TRINITY_DN214_c0_g1_i1.p1  ORF type:complete len:225 (-),score=74.34 TRINITY_DN214_c0_g1_i1:133-807(-)
MSSHKVHNPLQVSAALYQYVLQQSLREHPVLEELRKFTEPHPRAGMQSSPDEVQLLTLLLKTIGAKRGIEVGVFLGYSTLAFALEVGAGGHILALDISDEFTRDARRFWEKAGVADRIELVLAPAADTLKQRLDRGEAGTYDFAFIDADKVNYPTYYEQVLELLRPGGLIFVDNVLWDGAVIDQDKTDADTVAIRTVNSKIRDDQRVDIAMLAIADGVTIARKK